VLEIGLIKMFDWKKKVFDSRTLSSGSQHYFYWSETEERRRQGRSGAEDGRDFLHDNY